MLDEQRFSVIVGGIRRDWQFLRLPLLFNNSEILPGARASLFNATRLTCHCSKMVPSNPCRRNRPWTKPP